MKGSSLLACVMLLAMPLPGAEWTDNFTFEPVPMPEGVDPQVGAMGALPDGRLAVAFHRGELMILDPATGKWSLFASGLQEPLGMLVESPSSILVMQRAELTRIRDVNGDGRADRFDTIFDGFGMTGNYHEFAYGPAKAKDGSLYVALGLASNMAPMSPEIRGEFSTIGRLDRSQMSNPREWNRNKDRAGRMYGRVAYRGWVMRGSPDGSKWEPFASGFRSPNGIAFDAAGRLLVTDNQGDWRPTSPLYSVGKGKFYGHPASLVWTPGWKKGDPDLFDAKELESMGEAPAGFFPHGELANSPTEPAILPKGAVPDAIAGQTVIGEMNQNTLVRVLDDEVKGVHQVALVPFFDGSPLGIGNNRLAFGKDGSMYVGKSALAWAGSNGIMRVRWRGEPFFAIERIKAQRGGFAVRFTEGIDRSTLSSLRVKCHTYRATSNYGGPKLDESNLIPGDLKLAGDGRTITFNVGDLKEHYLYEINASAVKSSDGDQLLGKKAWYFAGKSPD